MSLGAQFVQKICHRFAATAIEKGSSKKDYLDELDILDKFEQYRLDNASGLYISHKALLRAIEEVFEVEFDQAGQKFAGLKWKAPEKPKVFVPMQSKTWAEQQAEMRFRSFRDERKPHYWRTNGFTSQQFANYFKTSMTSSGTYLDYDTISVAEAEKFLKGSELVRFDETSNLWYPTEV